MTLVHLQGPAPVVSPPLGCLCVYAALRQAGWGVELVDLQVVGDLPLHGEAIASLVASEAGQIVGIGCMVHMLPTLVVCVRTLREAMPGLRIVLGGPGPSSVAGPLLEAFPFVDAVVLGEGEETFPQVVACLLGGGDLASIPGLVIPGPAGPVCTGPPRRITNLEVLPLPAYDAVDLSRYNGAIPVELARGCPYGCTFCETSRFWGHRVIQYSVPRVTALLRHLRETLGQSTFGFVDDTFGLHRAQARAVMEAMGQLGASWTCSLRLEQLDEPWVDLLQATGCTGVFLGVESGSGAVLARIRKGGVRPEEVPSRVRLLSGRFDPVTASFIWGFPFESVAETAETLALASSLRDLGVATPLHLLCALPQAPLTREFAHLRRFDPSTVSDLSPLPPEPGVHDLVASHVDVFSSFYHFHHPGLALKRVLVQRYGRWAGRTPSTRQAGHPAGGEPRACP